MRLRSLSTLIFSIGLLGLLAQPAGAASFSPSATFKLSSTVVKANPTFTITVHQDAGEEEIAKVVLLVPHGFHLPSDAAINGGEKLGQGTITVAITPACNSASQQTNPATITEKNRTAAQKSSGVFSVWHVNIQQVVSFDLVWKGSVSNGFTGTAKIPHTAVTCPPFTFKATINKKSSSTHHKILVNPSSAGNYTFKAHFVSRPSKIKRTVSKTFKITAS